MSPLPTLSDRAAGLLLHPTSLPGGYGNGDLGVAAHRFATFLAAAGQRWWQMLPVHPVGAGNSPYRSMSVFALSPLLISLELLERVGIRDQADKLPSALSGGQQQRAAIARALANDPPILMADEPTGNLDEATRTSVLELFAKLNAEGRTIIVVTHERDISRYTNRQVTLVDGRVADDIQK